MAEAFFSLLEKAYWEWTISFRQLLNKVGEKCELGSSGMIYVKRFFYDAYSDCINGSIFDGLKLDLVSFASKLLISDSSDERLIGTRILHKFSTNINLNLADDALQKIGTSISVIERLVGMLNWKNPREAEIRQAAAEILSKLARKKHNSLRVAGIPGAMKSISSLLYIQHNSNRASDETWEREIVYDRENELSACNQLGLTILKKLARNHDNCEIGNTRGLLPKSIDFTYTGERLLTNSHDRDSRILAAKRSLQVLKLLTRTSGTAGKHLRQEIVEIVFTVSNIREILKYGEKFAKLQHLGIEILTNLAFDVEATERIGSTGGLIKELFRIFFQEERNSEDQYLIVKVAAGEAIAMLALESEKNCSRILKQDVLTKLVWALEDPVLRINSARILRNVCTYAGQDCSVKLEGICAAAAPTVLGTIMSEENKLQEVMLGLAAQLFRFMNCEEARIAFKKTGINKAKLAKKLVEILEFYKYPSSKVPRMRRFAIELAISMMENDRTTIRTFRDLRMVKKLKILGETISEIGSFNVFSGTVGLSRHNTPIHSPVDNALQLVASPDHLPVAGGELLF